MTLNYLALLVETEAPPNVVRYRTYFQVKHKAKIQITLSVSRSSNHINKRQLEWKCLQQEFGTIASLYKEHASKKESVTARRQ
jgi:hypothetical protein